MTDTTRLAPSPTGALHLGNARTFLVNWLLARQQGWRVRMRVEDLDGPRVKPRAAAVMLDELAYLGLTWEGPVVWQSQRAEAYRAALERLIELGAAYPCVCSRKDVEQAASAPHRGEGETAYAGTCRGRLAGARQDAATATGKPAAWRVRLDEAPILVKDEFAGERLFDLSKICGDFVIFKNDGTCAYQLAVVVDDDAAGVTAIVRGDDLLDSAARQIHLRRLLGLTGPVRYWHLPLVVGPDGRRLAKRHGDTRISRYRGLGATRERVLGVLGFWSGLLEKRCEADIGELLQRFDLAKLPKHPIVLSDEDEAFLTP
jgi:glutamyl-tRNA synthetase